GDEGAFAGTSGLTAAPSFVATSNEWGPWHVAAELGATFRSTTRFGDVRLGNQLRFALGVRYSLFRLLRVGVEGWLAPTLLEQPLTPWGRARHVPAEWHASVGSPLTERLWVQLGAGTGLPLSSQGAIDDDGREHFVGVGTPAWRALALIRVTEGLEASDGSARSEDPLADVHAVARLERDVRRPPLVDLLHVDDHGPRAVLGLARQVHPRRLGDARHAPREGDGLQKRHVRSQGEAPRFLHLTEQRHALAAVLLHRDHDARVREDLALHQALAHERRDFLGLQARHLELVDVGHGDRPVTRHLVLRGQVLFAH